MKNFKLGIWKWWISDNLFNGFADKSVTNILILTAIISNIIKKVQDSGKKWDSKRKSKIIISENRSLCQRYEARGLVLASWATSYLPSFPSLSHSAKQKIGYK